MEEVNIDQDFLMQFSCMGTQDRDVLISELHGLLDSQLSREGCAFFLDMTNWNLQAAVGAFYDHYSTEGGVLPEMTLVSRKSSPEQASGGLTLPPGTPFTETWILKNTGTMPWPLGTHLVAKTGEELSRLHSIHLPLLSPGTETSVSLDFQAPTSSGVYHCQWRACTAGGALFGDPIWVIVRVSEDESIIGLTEKLSSITTQEVEMSDSSKTVVIDERLEPSVAATNPFAGGSGSGPLLDHHPFGSGSMMNSHNASTLEQLLQTQSQSTAATETTNSIPPHTQCGPSSTTLAITAGGDGSGSSNSNNHCPLPLYTQPHMHQSLNSDLSLLHQEFHTIPATSSAVAMDDSGPAEDPSGPS